MNIRKLVGETTEYVFQSAYEALVNALMNKWRKAEVQSIVTNQAHRLGMRISCINPKNTSKLAYDGSGEVVRGQNAGFNTYELCKFQSGKIYNCDLSATYNIGARYFI